ncbi:response regulator [Magnetofaba australis]|uniref:Putative two component transcriptional regulator n=1 Tax=Magnetofaba australis IT-1 TaxID=1434232 RepID=A0A1Y2K2D0_9PROT|nr:response regulator [Magnetofaba australis]OSM01817.1 putative two component transcriptional regulator [Magnetofaba australis IT-1]
MSQKHHILVVEDDPTSRELLSGYFVNAGYSVTQAHDESSMKNVMAKQNIDVILLDIGLPGRDGLELTREVRARSEVGIILVSSRGDDVDRIIGLEIGADDYVVKPFNERELLARVKSLLRRIDAIKQATREDEPSAVYRFASWTLDPATRKAVSAEQGEQTLTNGEYRLLLAFLNRSGRALSRDQLLDAVSSREWSPNDRTIDVMVNRLRRKLEQDPARPQLFITVHGVGYQFTAQVEKLSPGDPLTASTS